MKPILNKDFGIYVWTSDTNIACLPAWAYLFNKFWCYETEVRVLGYTKPNFDLPENFKFISLGKQRGPKFWSNDMIDYYSNCEHEYFYAMFEDGFIIDHVNKEILDLAMKVAFTNHKDTFFRFNLSLDTQQRPHRILKHYNSFNLIEAAQGTHYRQSTQHSIWSKKRFLEKLRPNMSPWDFELDNRSAMYDGLAVYATSQNFAIRMGHGYKRGVKIKNWYEENSGFHKIPSGQGISLTAEDIEFIEKSGWMPTVLK